jgi:hypothetical protein
MLESDVSVGDGGDKREKEEEVTTNTTVLSMSLAFEGETTYMDILVIQSEYGCTGMI